MAISRASDGFQGYHRKTCFSHRTKVTPKFLTSQAISPAQVIRELREFFFLFPIL